jgi:hypothetical protein
VRFPQGFEDETGESTLEIYCTVLYSTCVQYMYCTNQAAKSGRFRGSILRYSTTVQYERRGKNRRTQIAFSAVSTRLLGMGSSERRWCFHMDMVETREIPGITEVLRSLSCFATLASLRET